MMVSHDAQFWKRKQLIGLPLISCGIRSLGLATAAWGFVRALVARGLIARVTDVYEELTLASTYLTRVSFGKCELRAIVVLPTSQRGDQNETHDQRPMTVRGNRPLIL